MKRKVIIGLFIFILIVVVVYFNLKDKYRLNENINGNEIENEKMQETTANKYIKVTIYGEVLRSGEYEVPNDWTLKDLISLVGITSDAVLDSTRLSLKLENNKTYFIDRQINENIVKININTADIDELCKLPSIGEVIAERIIEYRKENPFLKIEDIMNVKGIKNATFEKIKDFITV